MMQQSERILDQIIRSKHASCTKITSPSPGKNKIKPTFLAKHQNCPGHLPGYPGIILVFSQVLLCGGNLDYALRFCSCGWAENENIGIPCRAAFTLSEPLAPNAQIGTILSRTRRLTCKA